MVPIACENLLDLSWIEFALVKVISPLNQAVVLGEKHFSISVLTERAMALDDVEVTIREKNMVGKEHQVHFSLPDDSIAPTHSILHLVKG